jgi:hypothetical protein
VATDWHRSEAELPRAELRRINSTLAQLTEQLGQCGDDPSAEEELFDVNVEIERQIESSSRLAALKTAERLRRKTP